MLANCPRFVRPLVALYTLCLLPLAAMCQQPAAPKTDLFSDASNHWYHIADNKNIIQPAPDQPRYKADEYAAIADNILLYQKNNGGWPKNYDMQAILTPQQKEALLATKAETHTTFDNRTTYSHVAYLSQVYTLTHDDKYKQAALKGFDYILEAQYDNGGWPQYYPLEKKYSRHITYNDDVFAGIMILLKNVLENKPDYTYIDDNYRKRLQKAFDKGLDCIVKTQINDAGAPTAWCQQHDEVTLAPAWARAFEPPCICSAESAKLVLFLMSLPNPSKEIIAAVQNAATWFNQSKITGITIKTVKVSADSSAAGKAYTDKVVVADAQAAPVWTRYYELKTHRPMFCNRDSKVVYSLAEVEHERRVGYAWYSNEPQKVLDKYDNWLKKQKI